MSKVVFVGNVPYNMGEEQLIDVFKSVGEVVGFRLVFDRDTGKPKGYGFCEFADHETAASAVRNLNSYEVGGRPLRIDLADSDPLLEGKTTVRGELVDTGSSNPSWRGGSEPTSVSGNTGSSFLANLPPGISIPPGSSAPDSISTLLATINPREMMDVLAHMKAFVITHPEQARSLLIAHPQLAYALFQALLVNHVVDESILQRMLAATSASSRVAASQPTSGPSATQAPQQPQPHQSHPNQSYPPPFAQGPSQFPPYSSMPPPSAMFPQHQAATAYYGRAPPPPIPGMVSTPPPGALVMQGPGTPVQPSTPVQASGSPAKGPDVAQVPANIPDIQKQMLMQVLSMTPEQIKALPENDQTAILQLRAQFMPNA